MPVHVSAILEEVLKIKLERGGEGVMVFLPWFAGCLMRGARKNLLTTSGGLPKNTRGKLENHHSPICTNYKPSLHICSIK